MMLAFGSDAYMPSCVRSAFPKVKVDKVTSLDHSLWFHSDCDSQQWHLYVTECDFSKAGRTLNSLRYIIIYITRSELASLAHSFYTCMKHGINYAKEEDTNTNNMVHTYSPEGW